MKKVILTMIALVTISLTVSAQKQVSTKTHFKFFSTTPAENIEANNYASVGTITPASGDIVFSVPMQSFEFEKSLMQEHFNSKKFLNTKANPKAKLIGKIANLDAVNFTKDGTYNVDVTGDLTINGVTKPIKEKATVVIKEGKISLASKFNLTLADYEIAFKGGKPSTNIAKTVEVTVEANY
ncbi:YceI-like domain-containing protein [Mariniflexile fucanivorans]|uniref:YceI-like domain-containing protein n=1 Tax=Mariniflexile fucanivorans TaxID=264023 RepID=A0A4R1RF62_9FLAO|nr:YceI family protein [Mariniflexile fucanivorans]TCL64575.1 YceI-like domain-containing protein [Mariniflexile fucanivorans]